MTLWNSAINFLVIDPGLPSPIWRLLTSRIGTTSIAVPVKNASSAVKIMNGVKFAIVSLIPSLAAISVTTSAVIPAKAPVDVGGVNISPFQTMKMFSPTPSAM